MHDKRIKIRYKPSDDKLTDDLLLDIIKNMIPVSTEKYSIKKINTNHVKINEHDYYQKVYVEPHNCEGFLFVYRNPDAAHFCVSNALFLPKKIIFEEEWSKMKDNTYGIDLEYMEK